MLSKLDYAAISYTVSAVVRQQKAPILHLAQNQSLIDKYVKVATSLFLFGFF